MKKIILSLTLLLFISISWTFAQMERLYVVPKWEYTYTSSWKVKNIGNIVEEIWWWGDVRDNYNEEVKNLSLWQQFSTWVMDWDTILDYVAALAKLLSQLALLIWAIAIIWIWYDKVIQSFWGASDQPIFKVIKGVLVVIFAYFIVKVIYSAFIA